LTAVSGVVFWLIDFTMLVSRLRMEVPGMVALGLALLDGPSEKRGWTITLVNTERAAQNLAMVESVPERWFLPTSLLSVSAGSWGDRRGSERLRPINETGD
jgi:hypothetical protein